MDADNNWTAAEYNNANFDNVAGDAHLGAQCTYDYWKAVHGRNSYDNAGAAIKSYVHFDDTPGDGVGYENAYWDGTEMTYGDGASRFRPLTAMDVCGHEIGHAVCEKHRQPDLLGRVGRHERRPVRHLGCQHRGLCREHPGGYLGRSESEERPG